MVKITIAINKNNENTKTYTYCGASGFDMHYKVYDTLCNNGIDEFLAMECASWCELAGDGESYNEDDFDVYFECE